MIIVSPRFLKFFTRGFANAITLYPFIILSSGGEKTDARLLHHERIHIRQQAELLIVFFYIWYVIEFLLRWMKMQNFNLAYRSISFEREAYANEANPDYLESRKIYSFVKYLKHRY